MSYVVKSKTKTQTSNAENVKGVAAGMIDGSFSFCWKVHENAIVVDRYKKKKKERILIFALSKSPCLRLPYFIFFQPSFVLLYTTGKLAQCRLTRVLARRLYSCWSFRLLLFSKGLFCFRKIIKLTSKGKKKKWLFSAHNWYTKFIAFIYAPTFAYFGMTRVTRNSPKF